MSQLSEQQHEDMYEWTTMWYLSEQDNVITVQTTTLLCYCVGLPNNNIMSLLRIDTIIASQ